jgi:hypothetical protein
MMSAETQPIGPEERQIVLEALGDGALTSSGIALWLGQPALEGRAQQVLDALEAEGVVICTSGFIYHAV